MDKLELFCQALGDTPFERNAPMGAYTTFRVGGPADVLVLPVSEEQVVKTAALCRELDIPCFVMGNGSNLLVRDGGIRGVVLCVAESLSRVERRGTEYTVGAGAYLTAFARKTVQEGCMGLEWACGIPGTVGGACAMNAGAYGGEIKQILTRVRVLENGVIRELPAEEGQLGYRTSRFSAPERIVLSADFSLQPDDGSAKARMEECMRARREKQPLTYPSAGSTFKRPTGYFAGQLIQEAGLKGCTIGGAQVSELHAGFIINRGDATAEDILHLIGHVQNTVLKNSGVQLECEVRIVGEPV